MNLGRQTKAAELAEKLHDELLAERLPAGSPVMSARELAQRFSISTVTANRVLNRLVSDDVLYRIPQSGTFVKHDPPVIPVIAYAGVLPSPTSDDPIKNSAAEKLMESFTELGIEPRILPYHTLRHRALAARELKGTNGLLLDAAFIDPDTIKLLWEYPGRIVTFGNFYIVDEIACSQVIPDFTQPMLEFHRIYGFDSWERILLVQATHRNAQATADQLRHILAGLDIPERRIESVKIAAGGPIQPYLKAFRFFSQYDKPLENTLILSLSEYFSQGIREACSDRVMPDILNFDNLESYQEQDEKPFFTSIDRRLGRIGCKALELLMKQLKQPGDELPILRIPARLVLRKSVRRVSARLYSRGKTQNNSCPQYNQHPEKKMTKASTNSVKSTVTGSFALIKTGIILLLGGFCICISAQNLLKNPGFEDFNPKKGFTGWKYNRKKIDSYFCDAKIKHSGKHSLRLEKEIAFRQDTRKIEDFQKDIIVRGWVKYENLDNSLKDGKFNRLPFLGIWTYTQDHRNGTVFNLLPVAPGSKDWFFFEKRLTAEEFHRRLDRKKPSQRPVFWNFRIDMPSLQPGKIWFDDLELIEVKPSALQMSLDNRAITAEIKVLTVTVKSTVSGRILLQDKNKKTLQTKPLEKGNHKIEFDLVALPPGEYMIQAELENGGKAETLVFTKESSMFSDEE